MEYEHRHKGNVLDYSSVKWHIYGKNGIIATHTNAESIEFPLKDHLGSPRVVLKQTINQGGVSGLSQSGAYAWHPFGGLLESYGDAEPDYGFTGQEKDHESGLHNFRARAYHEQLGRFFAVDPQGQYHSPYVYGGNNPLMYTDPDGELAFLAIVGIYMAANITGDFIRNEFKMSWEQLGYSAMRGAVQGTMAALGAPDVGLSNAVLSAASSQVNVKLGNIGGVNVSLSPAWVAGSTGSGWGANLHVSGKVNDDLHLGWSFGGAKLFSANDLSGNLAKDFKPHFQFTESLMGSYKGFVFGLNAYEGNYSQTTGVFGVSNRYFTAVHENDIVSGTDQHRTAAVKFSAHITKDLTYSVGWEVFTGEPMLEDGKRATDPISKTDYTDKALSGTLYKDKTTYRNGVLYDAISYRGSEYRFGGNSMKIGYGQNVYHDSELSKWFGGPFPHFRWDYNYPSQNYYQINTYNKYRLYAW